MSSLHFRFLLIDSCVEFLGLADDWGDYFAGNRTDDKDGASETDTISILWSVIFWIAINKINYFKRI